MKRWFVMILALLALIIAGCTKQPSEAEKIDGLTAEWDQVMSEANGQTVNIYMWGGSETINQYMDEFVAPRLKEAYNITLNRVPITDAKDMVNKLLTEKEAGKQDGAMDVFWLNGENFKRSKEMELLWGNVAGRLPNYNAFIDHDAEDMRYDFGESVDGLEVPWGKAQFVLIYDTARVDNPPKSLEALKAWAEENPGQFTYPAPPDFTGSAFIRQGLYELTGGYEQYLQTMDADALRKNASPLFDYLNEIEPYLWRQGETYPESSSKLDQLFASGEVAFTMNYNSVHASNMIQAGVFPETTRSFVLDQGTLSNTHYLTIPFNAAHKAGAMAVINYLISPEAQIAKLDPDYWGDETVLDASKLSREDREAMEGVDLGSATLPRKVLVEHRVPEMNAGYVDELEKEWYEQVAKK